MIPSSLQFTPRLYRLECRNVRRIRGTPLPMEISVVSDVSAASVDLDVSNIPPTASFAPPAILSGRCQIGCPPMKTRDCKRTRDIRVTPAQPARHRQ